MKALSKFNITILLSACVVLPVVCNADNNISSTAAIGMTSTSSTTPLAYQKTTLYSFAGENDGASSYARLLQASDGNFYGTTNYGGVGGDGTVFKITPQGQKTVLYSFAGGTDGKILEAGLIQGSDGNFYGTTIEGGLHNSGTVFKITPQGQETVLYSFAGGDGGTDGAFPNGLIQGLDGNFYGTTAGGGSNGDGTVFKITPQGQKTVLYSFAGVPADGVDPQAGLIQGSDGNFYGTTNHGGNNDDGTVFKITPQGQETILHSFGFGNDGADLYAGLIQGSDGNLYGTTYQGGTTNSGTVFKITPQGHETVLYSFAGGNDGLFPTAALIQGSDGNLYGTTLKGGVGHGVKCYTDGNDHCGTVFKITPQGKETVLHSFGFGNDGSNPYAELIQGKDGNFYGTTIEGGNGRCDYGCGTVFKISVN